MVTSFDEAPCASLLTSSLTAVRQAQVYRYAASARFARPFFKLFLFLPPISERNSGDNFVKTVWIGVCRLCESCVADVKAVGKLWATVSKAWFRNEFRFSQPNTEPASRSSEGCFKDTCESRPAAGP